MHTVAPLARTFGSYRSAGHAHRATVVVVVAGRQWPLLRHSAAAAVAAAAVAFGGVPGRGVRAAVASVVVVPGGSADRSSPKRRNGHTHETAGEQSVIEKESHRDTR